MKIKHWNEWHYWLRGGVIGLALCLVYIFFDYIVVPRAFYTVCETGYCVTPFAKAIESVFTASLLPLLSSWGKVLFESEALYIFAAILYYFFLGMVVGLVYGKVKKGARAL